MTRAALAAAPAQAPGRGAGRGKPEMRWESSVVLGVEEARLRNVPIVLHLMSDT
jgi:hypothetical protein